MNGQETIATVPCEQSRLNPRFDFFLIMAPLLAWLLLLLFSHHVSSAVSIRFHDQLLARGDGKFTNVQKFVQERLKDAAIIFTAACFLLLAYRQILRFSKRRFQAPGRWIFSGWSGFICLNIFIGIASRTVLFWCLLFTGKDHTHNYTQWRIKQGLIREIETPHQAILLGNSQTRAQIDTKILNNRIGDRLWTTELHFPASDPYEMTLCLDRVTNTNVDYVVTYVSEPIFFSGSDNQRLIFFFGLRDLPYYWSLGHGKPEVDRYLICGILGDILPLYRVWEPLTAKFRGGEAANAAPQGPGQIQDLSERAKIAARSMSFSVSKFNKSEFENLATKCSQRGIKLVICCGQLNPIFGRALNPSMRSNMMSFLDSLAKEHGNVVLLEESEFPPQAECDYEDLNHVNREARQRYSERLAELLENLLHKQLQ